MKKWVMICAAVLAAAVLGACAPADTQTVGQDAAEIQQDEVTAVAAEITDEGYGAAGALADDVYTLEEMLTYALQDEYLARYEYELIMGEFGETRPFVNIKRAEEQHIAALLPLFDEYGIDVPEDESPAYAVMPKSLLEAGQTGVQAEIDNIAMYEAFLRQDLPDDVRDVFEALQNASEKHLQAFERLVRRES